MVEDSSWVKGGRRESERRRADRQPKGDDSMSDLNVLDRTFHFIIQRMIRTGQAPHYTEIAAELGVPVEDGPRILRELFAAGVPGWLFPRDGYHHLLCPLQQPSHPVPDHHRRPAEVVRPVRVRIAGGLLALSGKDGTDRCSLSRLRAARASGNPRRADPAGGP